MRVTHFCLITTLITIVGVGRAGAAPVTAEDWRADCSAYIGVLTGTGDGDDLEITYCMGQTLGIVGGLETGSRIGALSMASILAILLGLDRDKVFQVFNEVSNEELLGYCTPEEHTGSQYIRVVADYLARHPEKGELPETMVFFEALQEAYPCEASPGSEADSGAPGVTGSFRPPDSQE
jgi:hypothetical protein